LFMQVPKPARQNANSILIAVLCVRRVCAAIGFVAVLFFVCVSASAKPKPGPEARLMLDDLGFPGISANILSQGGSMLTVHFADDTHLLLTYSLRGLLSRIPGDRPGDEDRMVAALLVDIPSGKIIARTEWRLHDHGHYLWNLGHGRFLLRVQDSLSTFAPVPNLAAGRTFERTTFPQVGGNIDAVIVSSDNQLVTVETSRLLPHNDEPAEAQTVADASRPHFAADAHADRPPMPLLPVATPKPSGPAVTFHFFRISGEGTAEAPLKAERVGVVGANSTAALPVFSDGYLVPLGQSHTQWSVAFHPFVGKDIPLAPLDTSCAPNMYRISPSQFVSINCRGIAGNVILAAYDLAKHEMWEEPFPASTLAPGYAVAPAVGRFAISRIDAVDPANVAPTLGLPATTPSTQEVRVYQTQTGDLLLKIDATPVMRTLENFDLAPNGLRAAVIRDGAIEIHRLSPLTKQDHEDLAELAKIAPKPNPGRIDLSAFTGVSEVATPAAIDGQTAVAMGDPQVPRKPPSILNPGEKPEFQDKNTQPNK
jgi:hypothetical protein